jgi:molybdate/tungstate transport system substrate-binding protein
MDREAFLITRREMLVRSAGLALGAVAAGFPARIMAADLVPLEVAYAGSMSSIMEGPVKAAVAQRMSAEFQGRAQGSNGLAQLIVSGAIRPDVFVAVTPGPMETVLHAGKATVAYPFAHTEMVIAYSPKSRFAGRLGQAGKAGAEAWWQVLESPGLRFGRTDPVTDPQGRNIIFTMMLAAQLYKQPDLVQRVLGPTINEQQIFSEPTVQARLQSGELDAASAYKIQPGPFNIPFIALPDAINLGSYNVQAEHPDISLIVAGKSYRPDPLVYYAAALKDAPHPEKAAAFVQWINGSEAQEIFRRFSYDPPGNTPRLSA